jgi:hypothetical protein
MCRARLFALIDMIAKTAMATLCGIMAADLHRM